MHEIQSKVSGIVHPLSSDLVIEHNAWLWESLLFDKCIGYGRSERDKERKCRNWTSDSIFVEGKTSHTNSNTVKLFVSSNSGIFFVISGICLLWELQKPNFKHGWI